ncbi:hypothetical protein [Azospira inquinata]|uniref:Uncharacterized protein n=1 Tax=Azospira inquinata TaxID=2785627 RepID=A0A975XVS6_9RHOO|nr:hypothetical protein [Azospira inquinata]QWT47210.1 hypothetical protein J8L76_05790 [Azospira inquinata]QWT50161.1 hypothetical protein Azoinq_06085 [Azospira inquinata]
MDFVHFRDRRGRPGLCGLSLIPGMEPDSWMVVCHELPENPGVSMAWAMDRVIAAALAQQAERLAALPFHRLRWIERYYGLEDGVPEILAETLADIHPGAEGWEVVLRDGVEAGSDLRRHVRRELARLGDDGEMGSCFQIA